ncbi:MAG: thermonuclease family protein [Candidatus Bipolaricaulia bacterium]
MTKNSPRLQLQTTAILLLALALLSSLTVASNKPNHTRVKVTSTVTKVHDGDTIKLANGMEVRYLELDTPETHHPEKPVEYFGFKASEFNKELVGGEKVKLEYDVNKKDQYGRVLAYVYVKQGEEWVNVNAKLLKEGYARVYTLPPNVKYSDYFLELEREARENCKGLWQAYCEDPPVFSPAEIEDKMDQYLGKVVIVRYEVIGT